MKQNRTPTKRQTTLLTLAALAALVVLLVLGQRYLNPFWLRLLNLAAINIILAASLNLLFGFTGQFSLGHAGFMAIGAYVCALLVLPPAQKEASFIIKPCASLIRDAHWPFLPALLAGGFAAALLGFLIGIPSLRLRGDYLAIVTLGFAEIIRVVANNTHSVTNGALGLKGIPEFANLYWTWGLAFATVLIIRKLLTSSYGRAFMAIRDNEIAAQAMGVSVFKHKLMSFTISSFFAGIGGALLACLYVTIDPKMFWFLRTFELLLIVVIGGRGSLTGTCLAAVAYTILQEQLRFLDSVEIFGEPRPGMRMVVFAALFLAVIIFFRKGLMGDREFRWKWLWLLAGKLRPKRIP